MAGIELTWPGKPQSGGARLATADQLRLLERIGEVRDPEKRNIIVRGDNLLAMHALRERLAGELKLVYIDPPYATGLTYYTSTHVGDAAQTSGKAIERRAYSDQRIGGMPGYLTHMVERLRAIHELLAADGHLFLHCDWRANSALRLVLDELFGAECFRNEIVWRRAPNLGRQAASSQLGRVVDSILVYSKTAGAAFAGAVPRRRSAVQLDTKGKPKGARWDDARELYFTTAPRGDYTDDSIRRLRDEGRVYDSSTGKVYIKYFLTKGEDGVWYKEQPVDTIWDDFAVRPLRHRPKSEDMGYDTQKPEGLLERILEWTTKPGDLVADFFGGSGTTVAVAEALGRRWVTSDVGQAAVAVIRRRLLDRGAAFDIYSLIDLERRQWAERFDDAAAVASEVLRAAGAEPQAADWGVRPDASRVVVTDVDAISGEREVDAACAAAREAGATALDVLAWRWDDHDAAALRQTMQQRHGLRPTLRTIPMELVRGETKPSRLRFAERAEVSLTWDGRQLRLTGVRCPGSERDPWSDLIDAWMLGPADDVFTPSWRSYRTHGDRELCLASPALEANAGDKIRVVVLTVFGDEIRRTLVVPT